MTRLAENALKLALLLGAFWGMRRLALALGYGPAAATAAMLSLFLVAEIGWESQRNYSHSVLLLALVPLLGLAYLRVAERPSGARFATMGLVAGLALLAKYNAGLFVGALVAADLAVRGGPRVFARAASAWFWAVALLVAAPHVAWAALNPDHLVALSDRFLAAPGTGRLSGTLEGLISYAVATLGLLLLPALVIGAQVARRPRALVPDPAQAMRRVLLAWAAIFWLGGLAVTLGLGAVDVNMRWLLPACIPLLAVLVGEVATARPRAGGRIAAISAVLGVVASLGQWYESTRLNARTDYDYGALEARLAAGALPRDLVFLDYQVFANLRFYGERALLHPVIPEVATLASDRATLLWPAGSQSQRRAVTAFARRLGLCPDGGAEAPFALGRRTEPATLAVGIATVSEGACAAERSGSSSARRGAGAVGAPSGGSR